jgi:predicted ATP-grasp superfamily ATP-dependent carboligase
VRDWSKDAIHPGDYFQRRVEGQVLGVTFLSGTGQSLIIGCAESWNTDRFPGPLPFVYRGSCGPIELNEEDSRCLHRFAKIVHDSTGILGLWQADFIKNHDGWWLLEINPRWSSSMELLDSLLDIRLVSLHVQAIRGVRPLVKPAKPRFRIGKVVRYAAVDIQPTEEMLQQWWSKRWCGDVEELHLENRLADIPCTTDMIAAGYPMYTEFASGESVEEVQERLEGFPDSKAPQIRKLRK